MNRRADEVELRALLSGRDVAVLYLSFGPYHVARLRAIARALEPWDARCVGVELASVERQYPWRVDRGAEPFVWRTLYPERSVESVSAADQRRAVRAAFDDLRPAAVAVPGWSHPFLRAAAGWCRRHDTVSILCGDSAARTREIDSRPMPRRFWLEWIKRWLVRSFDAGHAAGDASRDYLASLGIPRERVFLKYDAVDNRFFADLAEETRCHAATWREKLAVPERFFFYGSRMLARKNHVGLVHAYGRYLERAGGDPWSLVLVGSGPMEREVDAAIAGIGSPLVTRRPFAAAPDMARLYGLASALVFPSWSETWGLIVNEALAAGLPILVSRDCPAVEHLLREGENGWTIDPHDPEGIAERMLHLASLPEPERRRMGETSRTIVSEWGVEDHARELLRAIASGAGRRRSG